MRINARPGAQDLDVDPSASDPGTWSFPACGVEDFGRMADGLRSPGWAPKPMRSGLEILGCRFVCRRSSVAPGPQAFEGACTGFRFAATKVASRSRRTFAFLKSVAATHACPRRPGIRGGRIHFGLGSPGAALLAEFAWAAIVEAVFASVVFGEISGKGVEEDVEEFAFRDGFLVGDGRDRGASSVGAGFRREKHETDEGRGGYGYSEHY